MNISLSNIVFHMRFLLRDIHTLFFFFLRVYPTQDHPFAYNTYGTTCTEVEVDVLTGETDVLRTDILYDCGKR